MPLSLASSLRQKMAGEPGYASPQNCTNCPFANFGTRKMGQVASSQLHPGSVFSSVIDIFPIRLVVPVWEAYDGLVLPSEVSAEA